MDRCCMASLWEGGSVSLLFITPWIRLVAQNHTHHDHQGARGCRTGYMELAGVAVWQCFVCSTVGVQTGRRGRVMMVVSVVVMVVVWWGGRQGCLDACTAQYGEGKTSMFSGIRARQIPVLPRCAMSMMLHCLVLVL